MHSTRRRLTQPRLPPPEQHQPAPSRQTQELAEQQEAEQPMQGGMGKKVRLESHCIPYLLTSQSPGPALQPASSPHINLTRPPAFNRVAICKQGYPPAKGGYPQKGKR
jgi:hypothetical protein